MFVMVAFWLVVSLGVAIATGLSMLQSLLRRDDIHDHDFLVLGGSAALFAYLMGSLG